MPMFQEKFESEGISMLLNESVRGGELAYIERGSEVRLYGIFIATALENESIYSYVVAETSDAKREREATKLEIFSLQNQHQ